jgi:hypothetical protein
VAFLDILGFTDFIHRLGTSPGDAIQKVVRALEVPSEVQVDGVTLGRIGDISAARHTVTVFSDCVVISTSESEQGLVNLLFHVRAIVFRLLRLGFLCRGGIAKGPVYHRDGKIFGPAMLEAYRLENEVAKFPRVILQPQIVQAGLHAAPPVGRVFDRMTRVCDDDDYRMVHSLWALRMQADSEKGFVGEMVDELARFLAEEEGRLAAADPIAGQRRKSAVSPLEKIRWFRRYFGWATDRGWIDEVQAPFPK